MNIIIARTVLGGRDIYYGVPNLEGAVIINVENIKDNNDYCTELTLELQNESKIKLIIKQEIQE